MKKVNHHILRGTIELLSGTHVGGSDDVLKIGGTDLTCIKNPATDRPYIPGSSIKGKMRSCLEVHHGNSTDGKPCSCMNIDCPICRMFGPHSSKEHKLGPTRLIVRDAPVIGEYVIENKSSTAMDRNTGNAMRGSLRTEERIAPGAKFDFEIGIQEFDIDKCFAYKNTDGKEIKGKEALFEVVDHALYLVEQTGIGAGTGKGFGKIKIHWEGEIECCERTSRRAKYREDQNRQSSED